MTLRKTVLSFVLAAVVAPWSIASAAKTYDVLELPAVQTGRADQAMIYAIRRFDGRFFATGIFGHILYSDDGGESWTQAEVPVRSSITDIHCPSDEQCWAVGHEAVILHSSDGGKTWVKQYDGHRYGAEGLTYYTELAEQDPNNIWYPYLMGEMQFAIDQGADKPFFRVYFLDEERGYAVGAYGMVMVTLDAGETWIHRLETTDNDEFRHIFDFSPLPGTKRYFLAGEAGLFLVADVSGPYEERGARRVHSVPWEGSFFTSLDTVDDAIVVGGLRGQMFRTSDAGDTWTVVEKPPTSSIVDSTRLEDGRLVFVGIAGEILASSDNGHSFSPLPVTSGDRIYAVEAGPAGTLLLGGPAGIKKISLPQ
jgi:photosystem II stability/assembly factor-like uncharacterized protein